MPESVYIGLALNHGLSYCRGILRGIRHYARTKPEWVFVPVAADPRALRSLGRLGVAGLIAHAYTTQQSRALSRLSKPVVNVCGVLTDAPFVRVGADDRAVGRLAGQHLSDRGLRHFGFVGHDGHGYSIQREAGFRAAVAARAETLHAYSEPVAHPFNPMGSMWAVDAAVRSWVRSLPRPVGVFTANDIWGMHIAEVCRQLALRVPEDVALVGVDNDDLLCEMARPTLSSVALPTERIGCEAAALLDRLLAGDRPDDGPLLLPPLHVVVRQSSDTLALKDTEVASAVRYIRERAHTPTGVNDVLKAVTISRRSLERRFRMALERSVWDEIRRAHMERARVLLASSELSIAAVAEQAGFSDLRQLSVVFRQETGQTPSAYRRQIRSPVPTSLLPSDRNS
jgi:LacI family transcriptional regulator